MKILLLNGPNLNWLGRRDPALYGSTTLPQLVEAVNKRAMALEVELEAFQSNFEGALVDYLQAHGTEANGVIINPGALTHYGLSLREALADTNLPVVEVHLSHLYSREEWRHHSVIAPVALGQITGFGWRGYIAALELLVQHMRERIES